MTFSRLIIRSLIYHWRTNAAVVLGVATAVAVLTGALLVGDSVRGSLRDLVLQRLGKTDHIVVSAGFVREQLAEDIRILPEFSSSIDGICPLMVIEGFVTRQEETGGSGKVVVYGVDDRFWKFHGIAAGIGAGPGPNGRDALISPALAEKIGIQAGATMLVRVQRPSDVPIESLHGRKEDLGQTLRVKVRNIIRREALGEFSLKPDQAAVLAVFLPLSFLQQELEVTGRVNTLLVSVKSGSPAAVTEATASITRLVKKAAKADDIGLGLRILESRQALIVESPGGLLDNAKAKAVMDAAVEMGLTPTTVFTYLANGLRIGGREVPYSLVSALDTPGIPNPPIGATAASGAPPMTLNEWAARDLKASPGDLISMDYFIWEEPGRLLPRTMEFRVASIVPIDPRDRDLAPIYPGITDSPNLENWDPPFPLNLRKVRPIDEEYWRIYRTTPKAFIPLAVGQELWRSRYGAATSIRIAGNPAEPITGIMREYAKRLDRKLDPLAMGLAIRNVRSEGLEASSGATDFGLYFVYFSFFLVVSALLLASLFFKLGVEQRIRDVGLLRAVGFGPAAVRKLFLAEGLVLSLAGTIAGTAGGLCYGYLIVTALGSWWVGAVGTTAITLHVSVASMLGGALGGIAATMVCIWATLRNLAHISERSLLSGQLDAGALPETARRRKGRTLQTVAMGLAILGIALMVAGGMEWIARAGAFFGAGAALLAACLCFFLFRLNQPVRSTVDDRGVWPVFRLGLRNATYRPARSVTSIATIAAAAFVLISIDAFRGDDSAVETSPRSGTGGYSLMVDSLIPIVHDPASREGKEALGISELDSTTIEPFRVRPGDDTSCLNLYTPQNPRILAPQDNFIAAGRFAFQSSLAANDAERANPWLLLQREEPDGAVPVIADSNSMAYVLHRKLGDVIVLTDGDRSIRLRLVAALRDSIFQGELLMSQPQFLRLFPEREGYSFFLIQTPRERSADTIKTMEGALRDYGAVAKPTVERLAEFHRVENTYLSTFQMLGGLGLLLGTVGLAALMMRNALERRRELALLRALGYQPVHFFAMAIAENALLLLGGLLTGAVSATMAIAPVLLDRGGRLPAFSLLILLCAVFVVGMIASLAATAAALRAPLLPALRSE